MTVPTFSLSLLIHLSLSCLWICLRTFLLLPPSFSVSGWHLFAALCLTLRESLTACLPLSVSTAVLHTHTMPSIYCLLLNSGEKLSSPPPIPDRLWTGRRKEEGGRKKKEEFGWTLHAGGGRRCAFWQAGSGGEAGEKSLPFSTVHGKRHFLLCQQAVTDHFCLRHCLLYLKRQNNRLSPASQNSSHICHAVL